MGFNLIVENQSHQVDASVESDRIRISPEDVRARLGWELKPEGLCRGTVCIPVRDRAKLVSAAGVDLETLADLLDRPLAIDRDARAAALGESAGVRASRLESLEAPDFELPDLGGRLHRLSDHRGKKVLLIAYASW